MTVTISGTSGITSPGGDTNVSTTSSGNVTAAAVIPSGSTIPSNGVFLPTGNTVGISTASTERARIDSSGNFLVGTTSNTNSSRAVFTSTSTSSSGTQSSIEVYGGGISENGAQIGMFNTYSGTSTPNKWVRVDNSGAFSIVNSAYNGVIFRMTDGGNLTISGATATKASGTAWANPSDQRLKNDVSDYDKGLKELLQVRVRTWEYNGKGGTTQGIKGIGVLADEIMNVLPETVDTYQAKLNPDDEQETDIKRFDATEITWLLVKSIQELKAELDELKSAVK